MYSVEFSAPNITFVCETLDHWSSLGREIIARAESATWELADWAAMAPKFGKKPKEGEQKDDWHTLKEFCEAHGMNYGAVKTYAWVARQIPRSRRIDLSFGHHQTVAPLDEAEQDAWLARAEKEKLSVVRLRELIRESLGEKSAKISGGPATEYPTRHVLDLQHWLTKQPQDFWTPTVKEFWKKELRPLVEFWEGL